MAILLLICLFVEVIGFYFVFLVRRDAVKQEVWSYLQQKHQNNYAQVLSFPLNSSGTEEMPDWENEKEFSWKGVMYDVIDKKESDGKLVVTCISDDKETSLINNFEKTFSANTSNKNTKGSANQLIRLLTMPYLALSNQDDPLQLPGLHEYSDRYCLYFTQHSQDTLTPPPQIG
jgi:hypothetical protein